MALIVHLNLNLVLKTKIAEFSSCIAEVGWGLIGAAAGQVIQREFFESATGSELIFVGMGSEGLMQAQSHCFSCQI